MRFTDPYQYAASIRAAEVKLTGTEAGPFAAKLIRIDLHRLWMQRFSENLARILHLDIHPGRIVISFPTQGGSRFVYDGHEMQPTDMIRFSEAHSGFQRTAGSGHFARPRSERR
jgi:hypothetical protein